MRKRAVPSFLHSFMSGLASSPMVASSPPTSQQSSSIDDARPAPSALHGRHAAMHAVDGTDGAAIARSDDAGTRARARLALPSLRGQQRVPSTPASKEAYGEEPPRGIPFVSSGFFELGGVPPAPGLAHADPPASSRDARSVASTLSR